MKVFGHKNEVQADFDATNQRLYEAGFDQFVSATIMPVATTSSGTSATW